MGRVPVPMQPIPPDATPEERQRIAREYRAYLERGVQRTNAQYHEALIYLIALGMIVIMLLMIWTMTK